MGRYVGDWDGSLVKCGVVGGTVGSEDDCKEGFQVKATIGC